MLSLKQKKQAPKVMKMSEVKKKPKVQIKTKGSGQAPALSSGLWKEWLQWILQTAGPRIYFVIFLTGAFGLRCGEALCLKRQDINVEATIPKICVTGENHGGRKSPGQVYIRKQHLMLLKKYLDKGVTTQRLKKHKHGKGNSKLIKVENTFVAPKSGFLFASREGAKYPYLHYHAVYDHVRRQAPHFLQHLKDKGEKWGPEVAKLRPHSGRATLITELMGEGLTTALSMKYARHAPNSYRVHLRYGRLTMADLKQACDATRASNPKKTKHPWAEMSNKDLLICQKEITAELARRDALK